MKTPNSDSEETRFVNAIVDSFEQQPIPPAPTVDRTIANAQKLTMPELRSNSLGESHLSRFTQTLAAVPVVAICIALLIAFSRSTTENVHSDVASETQLQSDIVAVESEPDLSVDESPHDAQVTDKSEFSVERSPQPPRLATAFAALSEIVTQKKNDPARLSVLFAPYVGSSDLERLQSTLHSVGLPKGIQSAREGSLANHTWCAGVGDLSYSYDVNFGLLLDDLKKLTNEFLGDAVFDDLINGLLTDTDGPNVDVHKLFRAFSDEIAVMVRPSKKASVHGTLMVVIPLKNAQVVRGAVKRIMQVEPDSTRQVRNGITIYVVEPASKGVEVELADLGFDEQENPRHEQETLRQLPYAICVTNNTLIWGEQQMVYSALDRLHP